MTTPLKRQRPTELEQVIQRLRSAASDLEGAAYAAGDAVADIESAMDPDHSSATESEPDLADLVAALHDDEHTGPMRWCTREACQRAENMRSYG